MIKNNKTLKAVILTAIITTLIVGGTCVAAVALTAKEIGFTSTNEGWNVTNVEDAMNDLYVEANKTKIYNLGIGTSFDIKELYPDIDYTKLNDSNFILEPMTTSGQTNYQSNPSLYKEEYQYSIAYWKGANFIKEYNSSTGVLTVSLTTNFSYANCNSAWKVGKSNSINSSIKLNAYMVL